jgi:hypothetical protein
MVGRSGLRIHSAKADHVFNKLIPEIDQTAFGVLEVSVSGELDDAGFEVVIDLLPHLVLDAFLY